MVFKGEKQKQQEKKVREQSQSSGSDSDDDDYELPGVRNFGTGTIHSTLAVFLWLKWLLAIGWQQYVAIIHLFCIMKISTFFSSFWRWSFSFLPAFLSFLFFSFYDLIIFIVYFVFFLFFFVSRKLYILCFFLFFPWSWTWTLFF